jgi:hypothetical protein
MGHSRAIFLQYFRCRREILSGAKGAVAIPEPRQLVGAHPALPEEERINASRTASNAQKRSFLLTAPLIAQWRGLTFRRSSLALALLFLHMQIPSEEETEARKSPELEPSTALHPPALSARWSVCNAGFPFPLGIENTDEYRHDDVGWSNYSDFPKQTHSTATNHDIGCCCRSVDALTHSLDVSKRTGITMSL